MQIIRGDDYQSWVYSNKDDLIVVDPWLTQKQVFPRYNWLLNRDSTQTPYLLKYNLIDKVTHIIITAHFSDHLDEESLKIFKKNIPIYTTHEASKILSKLGFTNINVVTSNNTYELNSLTIKICKAGKPYNTTTFSYLLDDSRSKVFHEPHMFNPKLELEDVDDLNFFWETSSAVGNAASPIPNAPQSTAMICIVLPKPIWSARMQPVLELTC